MAESDDSCALVVIVGFLDDTLDLSFCLYRTLVLNRERQFESCNYLL